MKLILKILLLWSMNKAAAVENVSLEVSSFESVAIQNGKGETPNNETCACNEYIPSLLDEQEDKLRLLIALPFTYEGEPFINLGFHHLAAAIMAMDHFNDRNPVVAPSLKNANCTVQFDFDELHIMDTGTTQANVMKHILRDLTSSTSSRNHWNHMPHAIAGPYNEIPATELAVLSTSLQIPMVSHRGIDQNLLLGNKYPTVSQVNPDLYSDMEILVDYLKYINRSQYVAVLYEASTDSAIQRVETLQSLTQVSDKDSNSVMKIKAFGYTSPSANLNEGTPQRTIEQAVAQVAATGYRTILWFSTYYIEDSYRIGPCARNHSLDQGNHVWIATAGIELGSGKGQDEFMREDATNYLQFLFGSAYIGQIELFDFTNTTAVMERLHVEQHQDTNASGYVRATFPENSDPPAFIRAWVQQNASFVQRLKTLSPIKASSYQAEWDRYRKPGQDVEFPPHDHFRNPLANDVSFPAFGSSYMYDAVMAIALGACAAQQRQARRLNRNETSSRRKHYLDGNELLHGIRGIDFDATGRVAFGGGVPGSRQGQTVTYGVFNIMAYGADGQSGVSTDFRNATTQQWVKLQPFTYATGGTRPPELLRDDPEQNYLSRGAHIVGLALMSIALLVIALSAVWLITYRHHSVVLDAQPGLLLVLCLGSFLTALAILMHGFDESYGWAEEKLSRACRAFPWLFCLGFMISCMALFTKLWRINRVLQFSVEK